MNLDILKPALWLILLSTSVYSQKLYFSENGAQAVSRANSDGTNLELVSESMLDGIKDLVIDEATNHIYFIDNDVFFAIVRRVELSSFGGQVKLGTSTEFIRVPGSLNQFEALAIDPVSRHLYVTNYLVGSVIKVSLDEPPTITDLSSFTLFSGLFQTYGVDVDPVNSKIYYVNQATTRQIQMANTSGGGNTVIINTGGEFGQIHDVAVDPQGGSIYFSSVQASQGQIHKAGLDGSNPVPVVLGLSNSLKALAIDQKNGWLYWADNGNIGRSKLDGSDQSSIITGRNKCEYVTIDFSGSLPPKLYWGEGEAHELHRINQDGTDFERYYSGQGEGLIYYPTGVAVDVYTRNIYWTDQDLGLIRRGHIGETGFQNIENLLDFQDYNGGTLGIALDPAHGMMYYANGVAHEIQRADFNAANPAATVTTIASVNNPFGVAVDLINRKIYFTSNDLASKNTGTLYRSNLDGTDLETLVVETTAGVDPERFMHDVKIDPVNGHVYWVFTSTDGAGTIYKANMTHVNGSKTPLINTIGEIRGIEIDPDADKIWWVNRGASGINQPGIMEASLTDGTGMRNLYTTSLSPAAGNFIVLDKGCQLPMAIDIQVTANIGQISVADPLAGISFPPADVITLSIIQGPSKGTAMVQNNTISYTPDLHTIGSDGITYEICNQCGLCDQGSINITILNTPPVISPVSIDIEIGGNVSVAILEYISDANNNLDINSLTIEVQPSSGAATHLTNSNELVIDYSGISFIGTETFLIRICDLGGLCATASVEVKVGSPSTLEIHDGISPNGDGKNDYFDITNIHLIESNNKVTIYNRWGDKVFEVSNYNVQSPAHRFEGKQTDGKALPSGVYYYKIEFLSNRPTQTGYLTIKK